MDKRILFLSIVQLILYVVSLVAAWRRDVPAVIIYTGGVLLVSVAIEYAEKRVIEPHAG